MISNDAVVVLITGGRKYKDRKAVFAILDAVYRNFPYMALLHGNATGADELAKLWAHGRGVPCIDLPAQWGFYNSAAGHIRNGWMLRYVKPKFCIAFPGGKGTANMKKQCEAQGVPFYEA